MGRPKGSLSKIPKIQYPRKCEHCDYVSNNPAMYHYHKQIHEEIPNGTICDLGCGQIALFKNTHGKYCCQKISHRCPSSIKRSSDRVLKDWEDNNNRKEKTKEIFLKHCVSNPDALKKQKATLKEKWGDFTPEQMKDFRHYARRVRVRAQRWAKSQGYVLGQQTYHVDHKLSVRDAWLLGLSEEVVNHPANLQILEAKKNSSKGPKSSITLDELMAAINPYGALV